MANLKTVPDHKLDSDLKELVRGEREILSEILLHIAELDRRRLYLKLGFGSLFEYLTKHIAYSNGSAQRRIDAARLLSDVPELLEKIEHGGINLSHVTIMKQALRLSRTDVTTEVKRELVNNLENKSLKESQVIVSQSLEVPVKQQIKVNHQSDESVRLEITFSKEQWAKLNYMKELVSHSLKTGTWEETIEYAADRMILQRDKSRTPKSVRKNETSLPNGSNTNLTSPRLSISRSIQRQIFQRDQCCQYTDKHTGRKCDSRWKPTIDHIVPVWAGGNNEPQNLRILCAQHNQERYKEQANLKRT